MNDDDPICLDNLAAVNIYRRWHGGVCRFLASGQKRIEFFGL
jgi:hypothetical protein